MKIKVSQKKNSDLNNQTLQDWISTKEEENAIVKASSSTTSARPMPSLFKMKSLKRLSPGRSKIGNRLMFVKNSES